MGTKSDAQQYAAVTAVMDSLQKNYISLDSKVLKDYVYHFNKVLDKVIELMQQGDSLFHATFKYKYGVGSYFDNLKVEKPEEFDVNVIIELPVEYSQIEIWNDGIPGFVKVYVRDAFANVTNHSTWYDIYRPMHSWMNGDGFLLQTEFRFWFEGVVKRALNRLDNYQDFKMYKVNLRTSGPAMTLKITVPVSQHGNEVNVDLVPVIQFSYPQWPRNVCKPTFQMDTPEKKTWFIVPKTKSTKPKKTGVQNVPFLNDRNLNFPVTVDTNNACCNFPVTTNIPDYPTLMMTNMQCEPAPEVVRFPYYPPQLTNTNIPSFREQRNQTRGASLWRISFPVQEREMIKDKGHLKPVCRMIKKFRDVEGLNIPSYYIKTLFLLELKENGDIQFWRQREITLFLHMMERLKECLKRGNIPFYWDKRSNLIQYHEVASLKNKVNRLTKVINDIKGRMFQDPLVLVKYLVSEEEYEVLKKTNFPY